MGKSCISSIDFQMLKLDAELAARAMVSEVPTIADNKKLLVKRDTWNGQINQRVYDPLGISNTLQLTGADGDRTLDTQGASGTLIMDDGVNFRVTQVYDEGVLQTVTVGVSTVGGATWTPV